MRRSWTLAIALTGWLGVVGTALADGVILDGVSPRAFGRGGTNQGYADNGAMLLDNPAAMTNVAGDGLFDFGGDGVISNFRYQDPNRASLSGGFSPLPQIGFIRKSADGNWAVGVGMYTPAGFSSHYYMQAPAYPFPGTQKYQSYGALVKILPGLSVRVTERLSIGGTFGVGVGYASLQGPYFLQNAGVLTGLPTLMDVHGGGATPVWSVGMQYLLTDDTTLGATYQSASVFNLHGTAAVTTAPLGATTYESATAHIKWPQSVAAGVRHKLCSHRTVAADVVWYDWAGAFDQVGLTLQNPSSPLYQFVAPTIREQLPLNWRSSVSMKLGFEQILPSGGTFRIGYVYHPNPVPTGFLTPFLPATFTNTFTLGYGMALRSWLLDIAWARGFSAGHTVGTSSLIGGDFNNAFIRPQVDVISVSLIRPF